ncbi:MAG: tyrosine-type recombinase/integrase [Candidatus Pseudoruminococcus sp.]|nr:site-specific integrase [Ruminococcus sp.]MDY2783848.1 tyrosine-type recombinase/integrase [Candidatus Pseudoruminococcus sp.]
MLFTTGIRQHSLMELKIKDVDFTNALLNVRVTKTRKPLLIPLNDTILCILKDFLKYRQHKNIDDWLFCNVYSKKLTKSTSYHMLYEYNHRRGVLTTGLHRYRHTFAKQWILNGGSVVVLSKLLGHSNLSTTQNYINLLVSDVAKQVDEIDLLNQFLDKKFLKMRSKK